MIYRGAGEKRLRGPVAGCARSNKRARDCDAQARLNRIRSALIRGAAAISPPRKKSGLIARRFARLYCAAEPLGRDWPVRGQFFRAWDFFICFGGWVGVLLECEI